MLNNSWNPALNMILEIKNAFIKEFGTENLYKSNDNVTKEDNSIWDYIVKNNMYVNEEPLYHIKPTILGYWVARLVYTNLKYIEYAKMIEPLELNQYNNYILLRYGADKDMYEVDFWDRYDGLYRECRSVVIDFIKEELVLTPFKKFFNLNECEETQLSLIQERMSKARCIEFSNKLDGSMQSARCINNEIIMAGSQSLNPKIAWRLADGYKMLTPGIKEMLRDLPYMTFIFEYISMEDAHVVKYSKEEEGLYLIGMRNTLTGKECSYKEVISFADRYGVLTTELFKKTLDEILGELDEKSSEEAEGFVINIDGYKIKVKYNDYVQIHRIFNKLSSINVIIENIANGTFDDLYAKIPEAQKPRILDNAKIIMQYDSDIRSEAQTLYEEAMDYAKKRTEKSTLIKEFMIYVDQSDYQNNIKGYAKNIYKNKPFNPLKSMFGNQARYIKFNDIKEYMNKTI